MKTMLMLAVTIALNLAVAAIALLIAPGASLTSAQQAGVPLGAPPPAVQLISPANSAVVAGVTPIAVRVSSAVAWVNFNIDDNFAASSPPFIVDWDTSTSLDGSHSLWVVAYNDAGAIIGSDSVTVLVSNNSSIGPPPLAFGSYFQTLPPNAALPPASDCAAAVSSQPSVEGVPANTGANETIPAPNDLAGFYLQPLWFNEAPASDFAAVDGNFTGTTGQIIRWAACKWGLDENIMRAESWYETFWIQSTEADRRTDFSQCVTPAWNGWDGAECFQSYGIFQVKVFDFNVWPEVRDSTTFNADFRAAYLRSCMNGDFAYLVNATPEPGYPVYPNGTPDQMFWGCMGQWVSGGWYDSAALAYISAVRFALSVEGWP